MSNHTEGLCPKEVAENAPPLFQNGNINFQAYHVGWIISGSFALAATFISFWLISKHLRWYTNKREQRYIVRLLFLVPIYALISLASFLFWNHATPLILIRDAYEAIVLTAFFYLLVMYLSHDVEEQKKIFLKAGLSVEADQIARRKGEEIRKWVFPLGFVKWKPRDGLYFLQLMKWGVLQYCVIRPTTTLAAVILEYMGLYCEESWGLGWGHIYIMVLISISVTIAMYCLIQLYIPVSKELAAHKPLLKLFSIKAVVFLTFWQATLLSVLSMLNIVKDTKYMTAENINIGLGALLETFEMMLFAILHLRAFTYKPYRPSYSKGMPPSETPQWRSLGHAMDFRETFREIWIGCVYMLDKMRGKEPAPDFGAYRSTHYERAFGRPRLAQVDKQPQPENIAKSKQATLPAVEIEINRHIEVDIGGQKQWLYGIGSPRREKSEGLQEQIDHELQRLGYPTCKRMDLLPPLRLIRDPMIFIARIDPSPGVDVQAHPDKRSWWRNIYDRISQTGNEVEENVQELIPHRRPRRLPSNRQRSDNLLQDLDRIIDDHPPQSMLHPPDARARASRNAAFPEHEQERDWLFSEVDDCAPTNLHGQSNHQREQHFVARNSGVYGGRSNPRSPRSSFISPTPNTTHITDRPTSYDGSSGPISPLQVHDEPRRKFIAASELSGAMRGVNPPKTTLASSAPRVSEMRKGFTNYRERPTMEHSGSPYVLSQPPANPNTRSLQPQMLPEEIHPFLPPHRGSAHRRESATSQDRIAAPRSRTQTSFSSPRSAQGQPAPRPRGHPAYNPQAMDIRPSTRIPSRAPNEAAEAEN
ncbi:organic solute transporter Ostalpha-domain-containing protein [Crassisporium funariophilum]|nr:organic solute transporter Ostalpha-domain-containing protein [Crassisporium funariophilum]